MDFRTDRLGTKLWQTSDIELGLHIADVTNLLLPATAMNDEATVR